MALSLALWSLLPAVVHAAPPAEPHDLSASSAPDHDHPPGPALIDLLHALHGPGHDAADHDHAQAVLPAAARAQDMPATSAPWHARARAAGPARAARIDRPPRV